MTTAKCAHGYFDTPHQPCPWCHGFIDWSRGVVPVIGERLLAAARG